MFLLGCVLREMNRTSTSFPKDTHRTSTSLPKETNEMTTSTTTFPRETHSMYPSKDVFSFEAPDSNDLMCTSPINKVTDSVFIGDKNGASDIRILLNYGITHIINCAAEIPNYFESDHFSYLKLDLLDTNDSLSPAIQQSCKFIKDTLQQNHNAKIFVHCRMGRSRSASVVIYYLMKEHNIDFVDAFFELKMVRPIIDPNDSYRLQLMTVSNQ